MHLRRGKTADASLETVEVEATNGFLAEAESFERLVRGGPGHWTGATPAESVDIMVTLEALLRSAREGKSVEIDASA